MIKEAAGAPQRAVRPIGAISADRSVGSSVSTSGVEGGTAPSAAQQFAMFADGSADPRLIAHRALERIADVDDASIFVLTTPDRAAQEAAASAARHRDGRPLGMLDGIPVAWKDLFDLKGEVTRAGSRILPNAPADDDALLVQRLSRAGAVSVGKLNLTEFAFSVLGLNPHFGTPRNPWSDEPRVPGGSSSGCGVAVARGMVPVAIGTDTSGSVRVPAAFNGVVGFKPSGGRWPLEGCFPLSKTLDTAGVLCRTLLDAINVDAVARGVEAASPREAGIAGLRLVVPNNAVWQDCEAGVRANTEAALRRLSDAGALIERRDLPALDAVLALNARYGTLVALEAYQLHKARLASDSARMDRQVAARMLAGAAIGPAAEATIRGARDQLIAELDHVFDGDTLLAFPTVTHTAPRLAALETDDALFAATNMATMRNTMLGNFLDWCSVSIPSGTDELGLPTALLLSGGHGRDDHLLAAAFAAEPWVRGTDPAGRSSSPAGTTEPSKEAP
ncbi:amidase [Sphingosinicellaceae bacterium]|nr:amidase [Sphingosinicellaceae bacterium]